MHDVRERAILAGRFHKHCLASKSSGALVSRVVQIDTQLAAILHTVTLVQGNTETWSVIVWHGRAAHIDITFQECSCRGFLSSSEVWIRFPDLTCAYYLLPEGRLGSRGLLAESTCTELLHPA
jgi:hypothetical protein